MQVVLCVSERTMLIRAVAAELVQQCCTLKVTSRDVLFVCVCAPTGDCCKALRTLDRPQQTVGLAGYRLDAGNPLCVEASCVGAHMLYECFHSTRPRYAVDRKFERNGVLIGTAVESRQRRKCLVPDTLYCV